MFILIVAILLLIAAIPIIILIVNLVFINQITEFKSQRGLDYELLGKHIKMTELPNHSNTVIDAEGFIDKAILASELPVSTEMSITAQGVLKIRDNFFVEESDKFALQLNMQHSARQFIFTDNILYLKSGDGLGAKLWQFDEFKSFHFVNYIDEDTLLVAATMADSQYAELQLWQVDLGDYSTNMVTVDPYHIFIRPPKVLLSDNLNTVLAIYYSGNYSFGYGGPASRPQKSTVRIYSAQYPKGHDLVTIYYKGGTVIDAKFNASNIILTADPSRPYMVDDRVRPARFWQISGF